MLKRKLFKRSLGASLLVVIVLVNTAGTPPFSFTVTETPVDSSEVKKITFDSALLRVEGLSDNEAVAMPAIGLHKDAAQYVKDYTALYSRTLQKIKEKSPSYFIVMDSVFSRRGIPVEMKYLAIVESQLKPHVISQAGAAGAWQLMPATAKTFNLKVGPGYDERTNFYKSTVAAAKYLRYLHKMFDDWLLVVAAYNGGPGSVFKAIKKSGSRNFWKLQQYLPAESRIHVKKFISTHYYFEGKGSIVTLTKDEAADYAHQLGVFVAKQNAAREAQQPVNDETIAKVSPNAEVILNEDED